MRLNGAGAMVKALEMEFVDIIFGYPGAAICPFYDALLDSSLTHILTRNEQGAAHAASGYARITNKVGVCVATSGPGATNLITGIATAYMDSIPIVAITGQVSTELIGRDVFQEVDITGATAPFCKHNFLVKNVEDLPRVFKEAFYIARTGRPGPVLIDVPVDIQKRDLNFEYSDKIDIRGYKPKTMGHIMQIKKIAEYIKNAKAPAICAGGGIIRSMASAELVKLAEKCGIPVATTLMGIGSIPANHELHMGMIGSHGVFAANYAIHHCDLLILIGARVGDRAIGATSEIAKRAKIIHIDIDPAEIGKNIGSTVPVVGDAKLVLKELLKYAEKGDVADWNETIIKEKTKHQLKRHDELKYNTVKPQYVLTLLSEIAGENTTVVTEVGQNQIWAANYYTTTRPGEFITSGGLGTMGYDLPAAMGVKLGNRSTTVVTVSGDGSFQMSMPELGTIKQNDIDIKVIILNNSRLGMVRELQKNLYRSRYSQVFLENNPDFVKIFEAYGFTGERIEKNSQVEDALKRLLQSKGCYLLECLVDPEESTL